MIKLLVISILATLLLITSIYLIYKQKRLIKYAHLLKERNKLLLKDLQRFEIVTTHTSDGVIICDATGEILWANNSFFNMAGYASLAHMESKKGKITNLKILSTWDGIEAAFQNFLTDDEPIQYDSYHITPSGNTIWTSGSLAPVYDINRRLHRVVGIFTDITERKEKEATLTRYAREVSASIQYARQIQKQILPSDRIIEKRFANYFEIESARDIVSGDFRWYAYNEPYFFAAVADCTGHGVPGAFMSLLGNEYLHQIINSKMEMGPDQILFLMDKMMNRALRQHTRESTMKDGMDMALIRIDDDNNCSFAGAHIQLYVLRGNEVITLEATRDSLGGYSETPKEFLCENISLRRADRLYMFTDGITDLFGGPGKIPRKLGKKRLIQLLTDTFDLEMREQKEIVLQTLLDWKGKSRQTDDQLLLAIEIGNQ
jgi:PAS domain S-box-containing protein